LFILILTIFINFRLIIQFQVSSAQEQWKYRFGKSIALMWSEFWSQLLWWFHGLDYLLTFSSQKQNWLQFVLFWRIPEKRHFGFESFLVFIFNGFYMWPGLLLWDVSWSFFSQFSAQSSWFWKLSKYFCDPRSIWRNNVWRNETC